MSFFFKINVHDHIINTFSLQDLIPWHIIAGTAQSAHPVTNQAHSSPLSPKTPPLTPILRWNPGPMPSAPAVLAGLPVPSQHADYVFISDTKPTTKNLHTQVSLQNHKQYDNQNSKSPPKSTSPKFSNENQMVGSQGTDLNRTIKNFIKEFKKFREDTKKQLNEHKGNTYLSNALKTQMWAEGNKKDTRI